MDLVQALLFRANAIAQGNLPKATKVDKLKAMLQAVTVMTMASAMTVPECRQVTSGIRNLM